MGGLDAAAARAALAEVHSTRVAARMSRLPPLWSWFGIYVVAGLQTATLSIPDPWGDRVPYLLLFGWLTVAGVYRWRTGRRIGFDAYERPLLSWLLPGMAAAFVLAVIGHALPAEATYQQIVLGLLILPVGCLTAWRGDVARRTRLRADP